MTEYADGICWTFTFTCQTCGQPVQVTDGVQEEHGCPEGPALVIEGCGGTCGLADRVEQALDDYEQLAQIAEES